MSERSPDRPAAKRCHCGRPVEPRDPDPWEGRMDDYCYECATNRCDCYPDECPVKYGPKSSAASSLPPDHDCEIEGCEAVRTFAEVRSVESLLGELDNYSVATLHVAVDHGEYRAWIEGPEVVYIEGDRGPILTDALVSLERRLRG